MPDLDQYLTAHADEFEADLCDFLKIPSVSADPAHKNDIENAAKWVDAKFRQMGFGVRDYPHQWPPFDLCRVARGAGCPTVLVYGHYDVQPADPLELWTSPPFEPTRRDGNLVARGATDDKGQVLTHIKSARLGSTCMAGCPCGRST